MHCPNCGIRIESEEVSYCTRCGQELERIRMAMSDEVMIARGKQISRSGVNLGVGLMYVGLCPALAAVLLSPAALPLGFVLISLALIAIVFGSGPLLRAFQVEEIHPEVERARRREMAFGAATMYVGAIIATLIVAVVTPDWWVRIALVGGITAVFGGLLTSSKSLFKAYRDLTSNETIVFESPEARGELTPASLDTDAVELRLSNHSKIHADAFEPRSVTEGTTRSLKADLPDPDE